MAVPKIILFYAFTPLADPEAIRLWQRDLCRGLNLRGRILLSRHGINGTVGGDLPAVKRYVRSLKEYPGFRHIDVKWSEGSGLDATGASEDFPRLTVKVRDEIVSFGVPDEIRVDDTGIVGGGVKLSPSEVDDLVTRRPDTVFFDGRNAVEADIGRFQGAVVPDVTTTRDFVRELDSGKYDHLKDKPVVAYCTGGIRCEVLTPLMRARGFRDVYQIDGGIVRYGEYAKNGGLWEGSLYVFDGRISLDFGPDVALLGTCVVCGAASNRLTNCIDASCREQRVCCTDCDAREVRCPAHAMTSEASGP